MRILDNEGEVVVNLTDVSTGAELEQKMGEFFSGEENDVLGDIPFLGYNEFDNKEDFEWVEVDYFDKEMTVSEWFTDLKKFTDSCLSEE